MRIRILTDSAADFSQQELAERGIICVPMQITFGNDTYTDGLDLPVELFWQRITSGENPKTSQPSPDAFLTAFNDAKAAGDAVICVLLSSALSGTLQSAVIAKEMADYAPIYIVDSLLAATAQKLLVLHACQLRDEARLSAEQLAEELRHLLPRIKLFACLDTLEYLSRGGRIPKTAANLGNLVQLKPLITLNAEGGVELCGKAIGRHRAFDALLKTISAHKIDRSYPLFPIYTYQPDNCHLFIGKLCEAGIACSDADALPIGPTIATHIGAGAYGLVFVEAQ